MVILPSNCLALFPCFTCELVLRPIHMHYLTVSALSDWSEYKCTSKAWERGYQLFINGKIGTQAHAATFGVVPTTVKQQ